MILIWQRYREFDPKRWFFTKWNGDFATNPENFTTGNFLYDI